jgi:outer membrane protein
MYLKSLRKLILSVLVLFFLAFHGAAFGEEVIEPDLWGVAIGIRAADIPFVAKKDRVFDTIPLLYYEKNCLFIHGMEVGYILHEDDRWRFSTLGRYRFFDIPQEYQNQVRGNAFDLGGQARFKISDYLNTDFELLAYDEGRVHANAVFNFEYFTENLQLWPSVKLRWKSKRFNNAYYGLSVREPGSAFDLYGGLDARYHVYKNLYLFGRAAFTILDNKTYDLGIISSRMQSEFYLGLGFFKQHKEENKRLSSRPFIRVAHGWGTTSNLGDILTGNTEKDPYNNQMTSIVYGVPVSDDLFGFPLPIYLTPGFIRHHSSEVQDSIPEFVLGLKAFYTFKWPITWRLGATEGLSYVTEIPYLEQSEMDRKDYRPSKLLNYLDFSLDIELGDLFKSKKLEGLWLGVSIHHRSGIFESASAFGRIAGGSNINCIHLQYHW